MGSTCRTGPAVGLPADMAIAERRRAIPSASVLDLPGVEGAQPPASPFVPTRGKLACLP